MPKRTNTLQQLVYLLQCQFADNAVVTESKMMSDIETGCEVEVDVVVESTVGDTPIVIGFECTDRSRTATVEWVREMIEKHRPLKIDKTVLVSKSGFSKEAHKKGNARNVMLLSLEEAREEDWKSYVESLANLKIAVFRFSILGCQVTFLVPPGPQEETGFRDDAPIRFPGESVPVALGDLVQSIPQRSDVGETVMREWIRDNRSKQERHFTFSAAYSPPQGTTIEDSEGYQHEITHIKVSLDARVEKAPLRLEPAEFQGKSIAFGKTRDVFAAMDRETESEILVTLYEDKLKGKRGAIFFTESVVEGKRVFPFRPADANDDQKD